MTSSSRCRVACIALLLAVTPLWLRADYLEIRRPVVVRSRPDTGSADVGRLEPGTRVALVSGELRNRFYRVSHNGDEGWVYHTLARRFPGDAPEPAADLRVPPGAGGSEDLETGLDRTTEASREEETFDAYNPYDPAGRWYVYAGLPKAVGYPNPLKVLKNQGYVAGYDEDRRDPAWSCYRAFNYRRQPTPNRPSWKKDRRSTAGVTTADYTNTPFSRGHMAPNYAIFQCYGKQAQIETFLMTNACPQYQSNNDGIWGDIEDIISLAYAIDEAEVWVTAGPIFPTGGTAPAPPIGTRKVQVPIAFFMLIVDEQAGKPRALAFRVPHTDSRGGTPKGNLRSIREIERETGLDFFADLPDDVEDPLEKTAAADLWPYTLHR